MGHDQNIIDFQLIMRIIETRRGRTIIIIVITIYFESKSKSSVHAKLKWKVELEIRVRDSHHYTISITLSNFSNVSFEQCQHLKKCNSSRLR